MNAIKRNLGWLLISQGATWIVSIILLIAAPRILGDHTFGQLSFAIVYVSFFALLADLGINSFLVKAIARDTMNVGRYFANALALKLLMAGFFIIVALGLGAVLGFSRTVMLLTAAYCLGMLLTLVNTTIGAGLTGLQLMAGPAKWNIVQSYVGGLGALIVLINHGSLLAFAIVFNLAFAIPIPANFLHLRQYMHQNHAIDVRMWKEIIRGGFPFFILASLLIVYGTIDIPMLQAFTGSEEVGWYALAYRWVGVPAFFAATVATAFFPALSAEGVRVTAAFGSLANRALRLAVFVAVPAGIGIALVAQPFLTLLYGTEFHQAVPLLQILALQIPIVSMDIVLGSVVMATDRQRQWVMVSVAAAMFNPILNLAAIPLSQRLFGNGAIGAAVVTVLTELILMAGAITLRPAGVLDRATTNTMVRIALASLTMVPVVLVLGSAPLVVQILAGVVTYGLASLGLRTISVQEIRGWGGDSARRGSRQPSVAP